MSITRDMTNVCSGALEVGQSAEFGVTLTQPQRIALLSAVKTVTSEMPSTLEAAAPCKMTDLTLVLDDGPSSLKFTLNIDRNETPEVLMHTELSDAKGMPGERPSA